MELGIIGKFTQYFNNKILKSKSINNKSIINRFSILQFQFLAENKNSKMND